MVPLGEIDTVIRRQDEVLQSSQADHGRLLDSATVLLMAVYMLEQVHTVAATEEHQHLADQADSALRRARQELTWIRIHGTIASRAELLLRVRVARDEIVAAFSSLRPTGTDSRSA